MNKEKQCSRDAKETERRKSETGKARAICTILKPGAVYEKNILAGTSKQKSVRLKVSVRCDKKKVKNAEVLSSSAA